MNIPNKIKRLYEEAENLELGGNKKKSLQIYKNALDIGFEYLKQNKDSSVSSLLKKIKSKLRLLENSGSNDHSKIKPIRKTRSHGLTIPLKDRKNEYNERSITDTSLKIENRDTNRSKHEKYKTDITDFLRRKRSKKVKRSGVRFTEQIKLYYYKENMPPVETEKIGIGLISSFRLTDTEFEPILIEILRLIKSSKVLPFSKKSLFEHVRQSFSIKQEDFDDYLNRIENYSKDDAIQDLENQLKSLGSENTFYSQESFQHLEDFRFWRMKRKHQLISLLSELGKEVSMNEESESEKYSTNDNSTSEKLGSSPLTDKKQSKSSLSEDTNEKEINQVTWESDNKSEEENSNDDYNIWVGKSPKISILPPRTSYESDDSLNSNEFVNINHFSSEKLYGSIDSEQEEINELFGDISNLDEEMIYHSHTDSQENSKYSLLFNIFMAYDSANLKARDKRNSSLKPFLRLIREKINEKFKLNGHVNMFEEIPEINDYEFQNMLFILSPMSRWLLDKYAEHYGFSTLHKSLVFLNYIVSILSINTDRLLMLYILLAHVLDLFKDPDVLYNTKEVIHFAHTMKNLNRETEYYLHNIFTNFSLNDVSDLKIFLNILSIIYECNEFLESPPAKSYISYITYALEHSIQNHYRAIIKEHEDIIMHSGDPIGTNTSAIVRRKQRRERKLTVKQLISTYNSIRKYLEDSTLLEHLFTGIGLLVYDLSFEIYFEQYFFDIIEFLDSYSENQSTDKILELAFIVSDINKDIVQSTSTLKPLSLNRFWPFMDKWLDEIDEKLKNWVVNTCKSDQWNFINRKKGKLWSKSCIKVYKKCIKHIPFINRLENTIGSNDISPMYLYSSVIGGVLKEYIECVYNLFVEEFPQDLHSDLHDLYLREYYNLTTGEGGLRLTYTKKKRSMYFLHRKTTSSNLEELVNTESFTNTNPKLGMAKRRNTVHLTERIENIQNEKDYVLNVWSIVNVDKKKVEKIKKDRKTIYLTPTMCAKINSLEHLKIQFDKILMKDENFKKVTERAFTLLDKVFRIFMHMFLYLMNLYMESEIEHILIKSKRKLTASSLQSMKNLCEYLNFQLDALQGYLKENIFKRILLRVWRVIQEDIIDLFNPNDGKLSNPTYFQICTLEDLLQSIKPCLTQYGILPQVLDEKISNLISLAKWNANEDELARKRVQYMEQKEKLLKRKDV